MSEPNVSGNSPILTKTLAKRLVSQAFRKALIRFDGGEDDMGESLGCDGQTVNNAINQNHLISAHYIFNLMNLDAYGLDGILNHFGRRSVPIEAKCDTDEMIPLSGLVHKLAQARSDGKLTDYECLEIEPEIEAALDALASLKVRCEGIRKARAA